MLVVRRSASKHGVTVESIEHAVTFALYWDDDAYDTEPPKILILGPDLAGDVLELLGHVTGDDELTIFHAMRARPQILDLLTDRKE